MNEFKEFKEYMQKIGDLKYIISLFNWEANTIAPHESIEYMTKLITKFDIEIFRLTTNRKYISLINNVIKNSKLKKFERIYIYSLKDEYYRLKRVPFDFYKKYCNLKNKSTYFWLQAKEKNDYNIFKPYLKRIIEYTKKYYKYMYPKENNLYNCMLNDYESNITTDFLDSIFSDLKKEIIPIINSLKSKKLKTINKNYSDAALKDISNYLLEYIGFDTTRGVVGIFTHGFSTKLNNNDIRIAFANNGNIIDNLCTIIHEGGHGMFEQNVSSLLTNFPGYTINKNAIHESLARFYENILGRNINFWVPIYKDIKKKLDLDLTLKEFIEFFNNAKRSLIRTEADELTYCMHIIIRYELERDIFNNNLSLDDLPKQWNDKYKKYLGVDVKYDKDGILQDIHWSEGSFGYFPSYLVGTIFDGMLLEIIEKELGDINKILKEGKVKDITNYLKSHVFKYGGTYNIIELAKKLNRDNLSVEPLVRYFKDKYQ